MTRRAANWRHSARFHGARDRIQTSGNDDNNKPAAAGQAFMAITFLLSGSEIVQAAAYYYVAQRIPVSAQWGSHAGWTGRVAKSLLPTIHFSSTNSVLENSRTTLTMCNSTASRQRQGKSSTRQHSIPAIIMPD
jgi:hypothetical protein